MSSQFHRIVRAMFGLTTCMIASIASAQNSIPDTQTCPQSFHSVPLFDNAKFCQLFDREMPASMVYHAKAAPTKVQDFYLNKMGNPQINATLKGRTTLGFEGNRITVIISPDGAGSQVDILVKSKPDL